jgi:dynein heavy chain
MEDIIYWEKTLSAVSETIEVMQQVQKAWMYLENIFIGSEDIRRQLPAESSMFDNCDKGWMFTMKRVRENSTAKAACTEEGQLKRLNEMLSTLERIQKSLDAYLETKRVAFPRFYFVSRYPSGACRLGLLSTIARASISLNRFCLL